jgi:hypothetical protein
MPYAERVARVPVNGAPMTDQDNRDAIDDERNDWNDSVRIGPSGCRAGNRPEGLLGFGALFLIVLGSRGRRRRRDVL